jgi:hypothetical protein
MAVSILPGRRSEMYYTTQVSPHCTTSLWLTLDHIRGVEEYYRDDLQWSAGPHLCIDDVHEIRVLTPLMVPGVQAPSWNHAALRIEMLGNYDDEEFDSGRGAGIMWTKISSYLP